LIIKPLPLKEVAPSRTDYWLEGQVGLERIGACRDPRIEKRRRRRSAFQGQYFCRPI